MSYTFPSSTSTTNANPMPSATKLRRCLAEAGKE